MSEQFWNTDIEGLLRAKPGVSLRDIDPASHPGTDAGKQEGKAELERAGDELRVLQEKLFAQSVAGARDRVLVVLQAMDAAGKGGVVNHVFNHLGPHGLELTAFKAPTAEELSHDFLWRVEPRVPGPGVIGLFDRSHYEDVLIQRVRAFAPPTEIERRYGAIADFEKRITDDGVHVIKIMLHVSPEEQAERLAARLEDATRHWKFNPADTDERAFWPEYMRAFEIAIERTNTDDCPWYIVPANSKWYARVAVQRIVIEELKRLNPEWPAADFDVEAEKARLATSAELRWP